MYSKRWLETHPESFRLNASGNVYRHHPPVIFKYKQGRKTASRRGITFSITLEEYIGLTVDDCCFWCSESLPKTRLGLDRLDSKKGYVTGNCVPCCRRCNFMKGTLTVDEFLLRCERIVNVTKYKSAETAAQIITPQCPYCGASTTTTISASSVNAGEYRRTRSCSTCSGMFQTYEVYTPDIRFLREAKQSFAERGKPEDVLIPIKDTADV